MTNFDPNEHLSKLRGKDYLEVKWRLVWMLQATGHRAGFITIELEHDRQNGYARYAAVAWDGLDETWRTVTLYNMTLQVCGRVGMGTKSETRADFPDFSEKAETGALGRALAGLGFGTQFAPDVEEGARVVDSPVTPRQTAQTQANRTAVPQQRVSQPSQPADQRAELRTLARTRGYDDDGFDDLLQQYTYDGRVDLTQVRQHLEQESIKQPLQGSIEPPANEQQLSSLRKLCAALGREEPAPNTLTFAGAGALIRQLSHEYNNQRRQKAG